MQRILLQRTLLTAVLSTAFALLPGTAKAQYKVGRLVSNLPGEAITLVPNLVAPFGIAFSPTGPCWISDSGTGLSSLYTGQGVTQHLVVTVPGTGGGKGAPTGIVYNPTAGFVVTEGANSGPAQFIFDSEEGTISGWSPTVNATAAILVVSKVGSSYTGLAFGTNSSNESFIYAADYSHRRVDIYDSNFAFVSSFGDPSIPQNYTAFGIQNLSGQIFVTYASNASMSAGYVDIFDLAGNFVKRFTSGGMLRHPWGLALAPSNFGKFSNAVLVANNTKGGAINAFNATTGAFLGQLEDTNQNVITISLPLGIAFGGGNANNGQTNQLFFTAAPHIYMDGLFGVIQP